jgi:hypothetical protein
MLTPKCGRAKVTQGRSANSLDYLPLFTCGTSIEHMLGVVIDVV